MAHHLRETQSANFLQPGSDSSHAFLSALSSRSRCAAAAASFSARRRCPRISAGIGIVAQIGRGGVAYVGRRYSSRGSCRASWVACSTTPHVGRAAVTSAVLATLRSGAASQLAPGRGREGCARGGLPQPARSLEGPPAPPATLPGAPARRRAQPRPAPAAPPAAPESATHGARLGLALTLTTLPPLPRSALVGRAVASALRSRWRRTRPCSKSKARCGRLPGRRWFSCP